jgi:predicted kinase
VASSNRIASVFRSNPTSEQELYQRASAKLTNAADASDLNRRGEEKTRRMLTTLARSLGFTQVTVTFDAPSTSDTTRVASVDS